MSADALISTVVWQGDELALMELATLWRTDQGYAVRGSVVGILDERALAVRYSVECTASWETRAVRVDVDDPPAVRAIRIRVDAERRWTVDGIARADLNGLVDVDIQVTPSTNTLPIQRLAMTVGAEKEVTTAWIRLPDLTVSPLEQSYQRISSDRYAYRSGDFRAELVMGSDGLVERYGTYWQRVGS